MGGIVAVAVQLHSLSLFSLVFLRHFFFFYTHTSPIGVLHQQRRHDMLVLTRPACGKPIAFLLVVLGTNVNVGYYQTVLPPFVYTKWLLGLHFYCGKRGIERLGWRDNNNNHNNYNNVPPCCKYVFLLNATLVLYGWHSTTKRYLTLTLCPCRQPFRTRPSYQQQQCLVCGKQKTDPPHHQQQQQNKRNHIIHK